MINVKVNEISLLGGQIEYAENYPKSGFYQVFFNRDRNCLFVLVNKTTGKVLTIDNDGIFVDEIKMEKTTEVKNVELEKVSNDIEKTKIEKVNALRFLLESLTIDADKSIAGCEPKFKSNFTEQEQYEIKDVLFKIIRKF